MAKGWSFGALTAALKSAAFVDTTNVSANEGNAMTVGFLNIGKNSISQNAGTLDLKAYKWRVGEVMYINSKRVANLPDAATFGGATSSPTGVAIRFNCYAYADSVASLIAQDSSTWYFITVDQNNASAPTVSANRMLVGYGDFVSIQARDYSELHIGASPGNYSTFYMRHNNGNSGYVQTNHGEQSLALSGGGSGRVKVGADGTLIADGRIVSTTKGISEFWASSHYESFINGVPGARINMAQQGLHIGWNESGTSGKSCFINNQGGGAGGFRFRNVNAPNTVQTSEWNMDGASGNFSASGNIYAHGAIYAGDGSGILSGDGNTYGSVWGGWLSAWLSARFGERDNNINNRFREVRAVNQRQINNTNGPLGGFVTGVGDFGANDGYAWISDLQLYKDSAGWVQCGIG